MSRPKTQNVNREAEHVADCRDDKDVDNEEPHMQRWSFNFRRCPRLELNSSLLSSMQTVHPEIAVRLPIRPSLQASYHHYTSTCTTSVGHFCFN